MILQETLEKMVKESVAKLLTFSADGIGNVTFSDIAENTKKEMNALGAKILSVIVTQVEQIFDETRDKHKVVVRNKNKKRRLLTELGEVEIRHTLYCDKTTGRYFFPADEILKIPKKARIENGMKAKLISDATITSYGKAATLAEKAISRQTVFNLVKELKRISAPVIKPNFNAPEIYIEADEDHIHLNTGKPSEVKLVYVHEGRTELSGRSELINPRYFVSSKSASDEIWQDVDDYLNAYYRPYHAHVHLTGDGATWIRQGIELYPGVEYHLDKFHVQRALTTLCAGNKDLLRELTFAVYNGEKNLFYSLCDKNGIRSKEAQREILYLVENLEYIDRESHCCAESHVSHVLSARMSSRPMGWSRAGADRIGKLRAFMFNKGDFRELVEMQAKITQEKTRQGNYVPYVDGKGYESPRYEIAELRAVYSGYARAIKNIIKDF